MDTNQRIISDGQKVAAMLQRDSLQDVRGLLTANKVELITILERTDSIAEIRSIDDGWHTGATWQCVLYVARKLLLGDTSLLDQLQPEE